MSTTLFVPLKEYVEQLWPKDILDQPELDSLDGVWFEPVNVVRDGSWTINSAILFETELSIGIPGLDAVRLVFAPSGSYTAFPFEIVTAPIPTFRFVDIPIALRLSSSLFRPAKRVPASEPGKPDTFEPDTESEFLDITLGTITLSIDLDGNISISGAATIKLPPTFIGGSEVVIEASEIGIYLDSQSPPAGKPAGWRGIHIADAALYLPGELAGIVGNLSLHDCYIGNGGFSGTVADTWSPALSTQLFGMDLELNRVDMNFVQNVPVSSSIQGRITLPFFNGPVDVDIGINLDGSFAVSIGSSNGLYTLSKPGIIEIELESLGFELDDGVFTARLSGKVTPLFGAPGLEWPSFDVKELSIDSEGNVRLEGGWLDLREQYTLDFNGFQLEITKLGFGKSDDGGKWVGFSGALKLVDGIQAGASVEGLRITWYDDGRDTKISFNGIGVEFEVPDVLKFKGAISYREFDLDLGGGVIEKVKRFDGAIKLDLIALNMQIDGKLVVGTADGPTGSYCFFAIYLGIDLPAGIPLWTTGLALYGMAGLFALQMEPDKLPDEEWYGVGDTDGWYKRPEIGVTDIKSKWVNRKGSLALGAGITIGTVADNGFTFAGKTIFVIVFPGPILMIEGKANLLKERAKLDEEPIFRTLVVLDGRAGTILAGLDAKYKFADGGEVIDISGGAEVFFSFSDPTKWHIYLGEKEPKSKRIRAEIFKMFKANAYFMLDPSRLQMGAWIGFDEDWSFGPVKVYVEAWIEGGVDVSFKPPHFSGYMWLHGSAGVSVFGFGFDLTVDARFEVEVFDPFHILAEFKVSVGLPWPLPDVDVDISIEWGPEKLYPPLPLPLKEVAIEHFKVTTSWPLPRNSLLFPNYDSNNDGLLAIDKTNGEMGGPVGGNQPGNLNNAPVVPLDCRPHITFGRHVNDDALVGVRVPGSDVWERIGNPAKDEGPVNLRCGLREVALETYSGGSWSPVARKVGPDHPSQNPAGLPDLFGSWAQVPQLPSGEPAEGSDLPEANVKLWLWSRNPFDFTRHTGSAWDEWVTDRFSDYPCVPVPPDEVICCDFEKFEPGTRLDNPYLCEEHPEVGFYLQGPKSLTVTELPEPVDGKTHAICSSHTASGAQLGAYIFFLQPADSARVTIAEESAKPVVDCVDYTKSAVQKGANPRVERGLTFEVRDHNGKAYPESRMDDFRNASGQKVPGLNCGYELEVTLPQPVQALDLTMVHFGAAATVEAFNGKGERVASEKMGSVKGEPEKLKIEGQEIKSIVIRSRNNEVLLYRFCYESSASQVVAWAVDKDGVQHGPYNPDGHFIDIDVENTVFIRIMGVRRFCIVAVCANVGPDAEAMERREEVQRHLVDQMARWSQEGAVLEPHSTYRLKVVTTLEAVGESELSGYSLDEPITEYAYFRTEGPPGLTTYTPPPNTDEYESGLDDLTLYVEQTVPATVPDAGEKPPLPRPVYRAYDIGVEFNENYVDLMFRAERRDLGLYLYNGNNLPVRDAQGRLIVLSNHWGVTEELILTETDERWITTVNESTCAALDTTVIPHNKTLQAAAELQVLDPDSVYEARLVPLLLHEDFSTYALGASVNGPSGTFDGWEVIDEGGNGGPSHWEVREEGAPPSRYIIQTSNIYGGSVNRNGILKPGALLIRASNPSLPAGHPDQPASWTDYRVSVYLRSEDDDAIGVVFRYLDSSNYYRYSMDRERRYRRLVCVVDGNPRVLSEDDFIYSEDRDYLLTIEVIGSSIRVYQDGVLVFDVVDESMPYGGVGLYCWACKGARFTDLRVDDFRQEAPTVYSFKFTTSRFATFFHHLHSYQDETWLAELQAIADGGPPDADIAALVGAGATPSSAPSEDERRAYQTLADHMLGPAALQNPPELRVTRVERAGEALALLVESPEPIDWRRTDIGVRHTEKPALVDKEPGYVKLTDLSQGMIHPNEESVTLLLRDATELSGHRLEYRRLPGPVVEPTGDPVLFEDEFDGIAGLLFREEFGPNALDRYAIVDDGSYLGPSVWVSSGSHIAQTSNIYGGSVSASEPHKPGSMAVTGSPEWRNVIISATLRSEDDDAIGIVFRYQDQDNYYRFSMDRQRSCRRLIKKVDGVVSVLWEDSIAYTQGQPYGLLIYAYEDRLLGYLDNILLFTVLDGDISNGSVGLYCWANTGAYFESLSVEELTSTPVLWEPAFESLSEVDIVDEAGAVDGPSDWTVASGELAQGSNIHVPGSVPAYPGTFALGGGNAWRDVQVSVRLRSDVDDAIGVMFRVSPYTGAGGETLGYNYYRFSMDSGQSYRRLVKKVGDTVTVLWEDSVAYTLGRSYELTLRAVGSELRGYIDGVELFTIYDGELKQGQLGLYCWSNTGAHFERVIVADATRRIGRWVVVDEGNISAPSSWKVANGALQQLSNIYGGAVPDCPGSYVISGEPAWKDYRLTVTMRSDDDDAIGVIFRYVDLDNFYRLSLDTQGNYRRLIKVHGGAVTTLWEDVGGYMVGDSFSLTVEVVGSRISAYKGNERLFEITDNAHLAGRIGLYCWANTGARFERVEVRKPALEAFALFKDGFALDDISGWSIINEGTQFGPSVWTTLDGWLRQSTDIFTPPIDRDTLTKQGTRAVAGDPAWTDIIISVRLRSLDDDAIGVLFRHIDNNNYYRFSMDSQRGYRRLVKNTGGTFTLLWEDDFSYEVGRTYELTVLAVGDRLRGYIDGVPVFVVDDSDHASGQIGLYCWGNNDARFSCVRVYGLEQLFDNWLLNDQFIVLVNGRWTFVDEGDQEGPSQWQLVDGELRQTSNIHGGDTGGTTPEKPGTYAVAGDTAWNDYRLAVGLRSDTDDAIGVAFRYLDLDNYYRFSMDQERNYRRLIKKVGGVVSVLWEDSSGYTVGHDYIITVDCVGDRLSVYLDGIRLFTVYDNDLKSGCIALYCWSNSGACFSEALLAVPEWSPYYTFTRKEKLPAGTRVQVFSGNAAEAPPEEAGVVRRFKASLNEQGQLWLPTDCVDIRLSMPDGSVGHARRFLPDSEYQDVDIRMLRKGDGTGFIVLAPAATSMGSRLEPGQYRLNLDYRRDNRAVEPGSQVLSRNGNIDPEQIAIDIPW